MDKGDIFQIFYFKWGKNEKPAVLWPLQVVLVILMRILFILITNGIKRHSYQEVKTSLRATDKIRMYNAYAEV